MDPVQQLSRMKIEHENSKAKFDKWIRDNEALAETKEYEEYVQNFRAWEKGMLENIEQIQSSITRRPVEQVPQLPTQDLDGQLHAILDNIPIAKFTSALVQLCKQDHSIFKLLTEIVTRETKGTGYHNSFLPVAPFSSMIQLPTMSQPPPLIQTPYMSYNASSSVSMHPATQTAYPTTPYTQVTQYGIIPADWKIDEPVKRQKRESPPARMMSIKMPFKDFTQS